MIRLDPYALALFRQVADNGSFMRAAEHAHLDPTAISRRIAQLERELGVKLFLRSNAGARLTPAGRKLRTHAVELQRTFDAISRDISGTERLQGNLRIAANPSALLSFLPGLVAQLQRDHPDLSIELTETSSPEAAAKVASNQVDLGIGSDTALPADVFRSKLLNDRLYLVFPPQHPLAACNQVTFADTLDHPYVLSHTGAGLDMVLHPQARKLRRTFPPTRVVHSYDVVLKMVEAGLGISVLPGLALHGFPDDRRFVSQPLAENWAKRALWMYAPWASPPDKTSRVLLESARSYCRRLYGKGSSSTD